MKRIAVCVALILCLTGLFDRGTATETHFVPGQVMVKFEPGVVNIPARPDSRHIPLSQTPMDATLRAYLATLQVSDFEVFGIPWRDLGSERPGDDAPRLHQRASFQDWYILHFPESVPVDSVIRLLEDREEILIVGAHPRIKLDSYWPVDTLVACPDTTCGRAYQWAFENEGGTINGIECEDGFDIGMREAYSIQSTTSMKVGILDSGVDSDHDDLEANIDDVLARGFVPGGAWEDSAGTGHGTAVAGVIAAVHDEDSLGVCGIAGRPDAGLTDGIIVPLRVYTPAVVDAGEGAAYYIDALSYVDSLGGEVPILNSSLYMATNRDPEEDDFLTPAELAALRDAVHNTYLGGTLLVNSAGNSYVSGATGYYPAGFVDLVLAATAVGCDSTRPNGFRRGPFVDIAAPGSADGPGSGSTKQIVTTKRGGGYRGIGPDSTDFFGMTSAAAPHVAGAAALVWSHTPAATNEDVREILQRTSQDLGDSGYDELYGHGMLQVGAALAMLDTLLLVHDSTNVVSDWGLEDSCTVIEFTNLPKAAPEELLCNVYWFEADVGFAENDNPSFVPPVWVRGRGSAAARYTDKYDVHLETLTGDTAYAVSAKVGRLKGFTYQRFKDVAPPCDSILGWYPVELPADSTTGTIFAFTYLADTTSVGSRAGSPPDVRTYVLDGSSHVSLELAGPATAPVALRLFDVLGRRVCNMELQAEPGSQQVQWNGRGTHRRRLPAGIYFGRLEDDEVSQRIRIVVVR